MADTDAQDAAEDAPKVEDADATDVVDESEVEGPLVPSHPPFVLKVFRTIKACQLQNGLRHNDHLRYRQYCTRKIARLCHKVKWKHTTHRGRYKAVPFPTDFNDRRYLLILLFYIERAWSYGMQLKMDNASALKILQAVKQRSKNRFAKAVKWVTLLETTCKVHADARTQLEVEAYANFVSGVCLFEHDQITEAHAKFIRSRKICERLRVASGVEAEIEVFKIKIEELAPLIRVCRYNLGMSYDDEDMEEERSKAVDKLSGDVSELSYRGQGFPIESEKIQTKLRKCIQMVGDLKNGLESDGVIERYGEVSVELGETLKVVRSDMIVAGVEAETQAWVTIEAFTRELSICMNLERNFILLYQHLKKLDKLLEIVSPESRKVFRPEEGMRFCDLLNQDLRNFRELPETTDTISDALTVYTTVALNCRCLFLALCRLTTGNILEAAALLDMLHSRVNEANVGIPSEAPLDRLHPFIEHVQEILPKSVAQWRCRAFAQLCLENTKKETKDVEDAGVVGSLEDLGVFPPKVRDVPCKPLLIDLALPCINPPDIDTLIPKRPEDGQSHGLLGRITGTLGGFWGRK